MAPLTEIKMASKLNQPSIVTRRKKRDLESTMKSLKKLLEPSSGSRKKNIPRSISKKVSLKKTRSINRFESYENSSEDGEYYPNKLKRKDIRKKIVLKPKHDLKVVIATNKRKRGTPLKGVKSLEEKLTVLNTSNALPELSTQTETELPTQTPKPQVVSPDRKSPLLVQTYTNITKYELISPPHRSLTELTVDDLMRMDEDSLSEDDLMEVLTCPSPVWWEDPPDYFSEGVLYLNKTGNLDVQNEVIKETADKTSIINLTRDKTESKRPENARETKKTKKIAKLEDILGNIKNRVHNKSKNIEKITDPKITNDKSKDESVANDKGKEISNVTNRTDDKNKMNHNLRKTRARNALKNNVKDVTKDTDSPNGLNQTKRRKISSSGSDISINDEDLLRNLENINIPIHNADTDCTKGKNDSRNFKDNDGEPKAVRNIKDLEIQRNSRANKGVAKPRNEDIDSNKVTVKPEKDTRPKKPTDDILDVRLLKIPTNATNEVRVWSKVENFQRHNWKPEDFHEVIDIENELVFSMIKCNNQTDPETICIDDDDEQIKETIDLDAIGKANDKLRAEFTDMVEITRVNDKANIKEDTIIISKDLDVRLIETPVDIDKITEVPVSVDLIPKPEQISQKVIKKKAIEPTKPNKKQSKKDTHGIKILPINIPEIPNSNTNKKTKKRSKKHQQNSKEKTNGKTKGIKIINNKNEKVIRINDLDISIIQVNDHNIERNETPAVKNDLCITLVSDKEKNERKDIPSKKPVILPPLKRIVATGSRRNKGKESKSVTPVELPKLTKNPGNKVESPKSINSISSDAEGTISDTNIQFLDEYDDKRSVDIVFEGETIGVDDNVKSKDNIAAEMCIVKQIEENSIEEISVRGKKIKTNEILINNELRNK